MHTIQRWGTAFAIGALAACSGGCGGGARANVALTRAQHQFASGDYVGCAQRLSAFVSAPNRPDDTAEALYLRGQCHLRIGARDRGLHDLQAALQKVRDKTLRSLIEVQLGNVAFDDGDYSTACRWYRSAVPRLPADPPADRVLLQYGTALQRTGAIAEARPVLARVSATYPGSASAAAARNRHDWEKPYFAVQCGAFTRADAAQDAAARLRSAGLPAQSQPEVRTGQRWYVVRVGQYRTYAEAERALQGVRSHQADAFVVP